MPRLIDADALLLSEVKRCGSIPTIGTGYNNETSFKLVVDQAPTIDPAPQWIPVTERLPEPFVSALGYCPDEDPLPAVHECYINGFGQWTSSVIYGMGNVTHWMPLPKLPEDGGNNDA